MTRGTGPVGVLVMAHGTPSTPEGILPFYTSIRRGRPPTPELLDELTGRYEALGGISPLAERTRSQVDGIAAALEATAPGRFVVRYGAKHTEPRIEEGVAALVAAGVDRVVGIVLTPHQSSLGSGEYLQRAGDALTATAPDVEYLAIPSWHRAPGFASLLAERTEAVLPEGARPGEPSPPPTGAGAPTTVFFTAHSLPERVIAAGDPYPEQVRQSAEDVADLLGLDERDGVDWGVAWQSAGRTEEPWIGPDLLAEIRRVADRGTQAVRVCPVGFVSDHLEVLYDLDLEATAVAGEVGVDFARTQSLNDDPRFLAILARVVLDATTESAPVAESADRPA